MPVTHNLKSNSHERKADRSNTEGLSIYFSKLPIIMSTFSKVYLSATNAVFH